MPGDLPLASVVRGSGRLLAGNSLVEVDVAQVLGRLLRGTHFLVIVDHPSGQGERKDKLAIPLVSLAPALWGPHWFGEGKTDFPYPLYLGSPVPGVVCSPRAFQSLGSMPPAHHPREAGFSDFLWKEPGGVAGGQASCSAMTVSIFYACQNTGLASTYKRTCGLT